MSAPVLDRRLTPARPDKAAQHLRGIVDAPTYVAGTRRMTTAPIAPLRREPHGGAALDSEAQRGEVFTVYDEQEGWSWGQLETDGYVGYLPAAALGPVEEVTHAVAALRTFVYPGPNLKLPIIAALGFGARVAVTERSGPYSQIADGWVWSAHLRPLNEIEPDFVRSAERFLGTPYLWGGRSSLGLDCSALVQLALAAAGLAAPRDSDLQETALGWPVPEGSPLVRGDLLFWRGHVGMMRDPDTLLHANGATMTVTTEALEAARIRIRDASGGGIRAIKRFG